MSSNISKILFARFVSISRIVYPSGFNLSILKEKVVIKDHYFTLIERIKRKAFIPRVEINKITTNIASIIYKLAF
jgi:hypothetical protein